MPSTSARTPLALRLNGCAQRAASPAQFDRQLVTTPRRPRRRPCTNARTPLASPFNRRPNGPRAARSASSSSQLHAVPGRMPSTNARTPLASPFNRRPNGPRALRVRSAAPPVSTPSQTRTEYQRSHAVGVAVKRLCPTGREPCEFGRQLVTTPRRPRRVPSTNARTPLAWRLNGCAQRSAKLVTWCGVSNKWQTSSRLQRVEPPVMIHAYHVIMGAYGFWLPNDPRGSWSAFVGAGNLSDSERLHGRATEQCFYPTKKNVSVRMRRSTSSIHP